MRNDTTTRAALPLALTLALAACGGADGGGETGDAAETATAGGAAAEPSEGADEGAATDETREGTAGPVLPDDGDWIAVENALAMIGDPNLNVYVDGPRPTELDHYETHDVGSVPYQARLLVVNEGTAPAEIEQAHVAFSLWREDGEHLPCTRRIGDEDTAAPPVVDPGEAHELRTMAICAFPEPGEYEVRAYVRFGAEELGTDEVDLERYFAGRYEVRVTGG